MTTRILLKRSFVSGKEPLAGDLEVGEVAINPVDGKIWSKKQDGTVVLLGGLQDGSALPTSDPGVPGALWNDSGTVRISQ